MQADAVKHQHQQQPPRQGAQNPPPITLVRFRDRCSRFGIHTDSVVDFRLDASG